uniref:Zinc-ribbon domain-containing protein n=1 Tax=Acanthochromis polyacanthus TaxID=80966 RepID=A0A3Q1H4G5_9TELE
MFCPDCGNQVERSYRFCPECGFKLFLLTKNKSQGELLSKLWRWRQQSQRSHSGDQNHSLIPPADTARL